MPNVKKPKPLGTPEAATQYAYRVLSRRALSSQELRQKLQRRGTPEAVIVATLERLVALRFLNDEALAEQVAHSSKLGRRGIAQKLRQRGVANDTIASTLAQQNPDQEQQSLGALLLRYHLRWSAPGGYRKAQAFLLRRGFDYAQIKTALAEAGILPNPTQAVE